MDEQRDQLSFASLDYAVKKKTTKREVFLAEMASVVPWSKLEAVIDPFYPKMGPQGWRSVGHQRESQAGAKNKRFGKVRAKVEHVFRVLKCQFGYRKVRYRGIRKNGAQVFSLLALANICLARRTVQAA